MDWISRAAPLIAAAELGGTAQAAPSVGGAYLEKANRFVHGYYAKTANSLRLNVQVEDSASHKMIETEQIDGPVLESLNTLAKRLDPKAEPFSTSNEDAIAAWGRGEFEKAVTLDPQFGTAWLAWVETLARSGDTAGAISVAGRAMEHPVKPELDGLRIALTRASLRQDAAGEREALVKLTARVADPRLLASLGAIEVKAREFALAEGDYRKLLAMEPDDVNSWNQLGYALGFQGKIAEAEKTFERYGTQPGQQANSFDSLGEVYFMNGKFPEAEKAFLRAHELNAALLAGGDVRKAAYAHWMAGDLPGADKIFDRYLDLRVKLRDPNVEWEHAVWEYTTGRKDQAIARLDKSGFQQAAIQARLWRGEVKLPSDPDQLKKAYDATAPSADGLYRTLYVEALLARGNKDKAKKLAMRWPLPDSAGEPVVQSLVFPKYLALRRILGL